MYHSVVFFVKKGCSVSNKNLIHGCLLMMDICKTCVVKIVCDLCGKQLCYSGPNSEECSRKPPPIEKHCHIYGEVLCVECLEKQNLSENYAQNAVKKIYLSKSKYVYFVRIYNILRQTVGINTYAIIGIYTYCNILHV